MNLLLSRLSTVTVMHLINFRITASILMILCSLGYVCTCKFTVNHTVEAALFIIQWLNPGLFMLFLMPAIICLACVGFASMHIVYCPSHFKAEKCKRRVSSQFWPLYRGFLLKGRHSLELDWHNPWPLTSDTKAVLQFWKHLSTLWIHAFKNRFTVEFSQESLTIYFRFSASCTQFAKYLISSVRDREGTLTKIGCNDILP